MVSSVVPISGQVLCKSLVRKNETPRKDGLFTFVEYLTEVVATVDCCIAKKEEIEVAIGGFIDDIENEWELLLWSNSCLREIFLMKFIEKMMTIIYPCILCR